MKLSIRLIRITLAAFLCSLMPLMAMESKAPEVEMYPDEMPKSKCIFQGDVPETFYYNNNKNSSISEISIRKTVNKIFCALNFEAVYLDLEYFCENKEKSIFSFFSNTKDKIFVFLMLQYQENNIEPCFDSYPCKIHSSVFSKEKWNYPRPVSHWNGKYEVLNEMSLRYLDSLIHCLPNFSHKGEFMQENIWEKLLYTEIKRNGLDDSIVKIGIIYNQNGKYNISAIYTKESNLKKTTNLIDSIVKEI